MNNDFPRIITLLRKERGLSQKQAAMELGVSQALLSHYEKGIRECGLDFVIHIADYYSVSCDYLLGRTPDRSGAMLKLEDLPDNQETQTEEDTKSNTLITLNKKLIQNSASTVTSPAGAFCIWGACVAMQQYEGKWNPIVGRVLSKLPMPEQGKKWIGLVLGLLLAAGTVWLQIFYLKHQGGWGIWLCLVCAAFLTVWIAEWYERSRK